MRGWEFSGLGGGRQGVIHNSAQRNEASCNHAAVCRHWPATGL